MKLHSVEIAILIEAMAKRLTEPTVQGDPKKVALLAGRLKELAEEYERVLAAEGVATIESIKRSQGQQGY